MFAKKIGIDLGTSTVQVYVRGEGIVLDEPAVAAVDGDGSQVLAVGREALRLPGRAAAEPARLLWPVRDGVVTDLAITERILQHLIARAQGRQRLFRPEVMICVPAAATGIERRAMVEAAISAGARLAWLIEAPLAAAMGMGLPIAEARAHAICDIGGGTVEVAVISLSGLVVAHSAPVGGGRLDRAIIAHVRERHGVEIEARAAEEARVAVGSAVPPAEPAATEVPGRDMSSGRSRRVAVTATEMAGVLLAPLAGIAEAVRETLSQAPSRLAADVASRGLVLCGGGARTRGIDRYLSSEAGIPVRVADDPQTCAVRGTRRALGQFEVLQRRQIYLR